ncbi:MAG: DUF4469 domain-containing protein [Candidatus Brocadiia bacterium]
MQAQDLPAPRKWSPPEAAPSAPGDVFEFADRVLADVADVTDAAPVIAEWNRSVKPDESFTMTGTRFTLTEGERAGTDTTVWVAAAGSDGVSVYRARLWNVRENLITASLPEGLPYGMYVVWVENREGPSAPVLLNRATPRWLGPLGNEVQPGERRRVFGRNLSRNRERRRSHVYLVPAGGEDWKEMNVVEVEPSSVEFQVPDTLEAGKYELYVHNGHGGRWGFGGPLDMVIVEPDEGKARTMSVAPSDGDDTAALQEALKELSKKDEDGVLRLEKGEYILRQSLDIPSGTAVRGRGKEDTIIDARLQRSREFVALRDNGGGREPGWCGGFTTGSRPSVEIDPVDIAQETIRISYKAKFEEPDRGQDVHRTGVTVKGEQDLEITFVVRQNGDLSIMNGDMGGEVLAQEKTDDLPLERFVDVEILLGPEKGELKVDDRGGVKLDFLHFMEIFGDDDDENGMSELLEGEDRSGEDEQRRREVNAVTFHPVDPRPLKAEEPVYRIDEIDVTRSEAGENVVLFSEDFADGLISRRWRGVADTIHALSVAPEQLELEGFTLKSTNGFVTIDGRASDLRLAGLDLQNERGVSTGSIRVAGEMIELADNNVGIIDILDGHPSRDYWIHGNTIIGEDGFNHAGVYPNGVRGVIEENRFLNEWPEGRMMSSDTFHSDFNELQPMPWLGRVMLVAGRAGNPRMIDHYFAHNVAQNVAWQGNMGEMILFHSTKSHNRWVGQVAENHGRTVELDTSGKIDGTVYESTTRDFTGGGKVSVVTGDWGDYIFIIDGTGFGQARRVVDRTDSSVTVDRPWRVEPDASSIVSIMPMSVNNVIYRNELNAFPDGYELTSQSASRGVSFWANSIGNLVEGNVSRRTSSGRGMSGEAWSPSWWNEYRDEVAESVLRGPGYHFMPRHEALSPILLGNMIRGGRMEVKNANVINQHTWFLGEGMRSENRPLISVGNVFEHIRGSGPKAAISESDDGKYGVESPLKACENLYRENRFELQNNDRPAARFNNRSNSFMHANQFVSDREELYRVVDESYMVGKVIPLYRTVTVSRDRTASVPVINAGASETAWTVETEDDWIQAEDIPDSPLRPQESARIVISVEDPPDEDKGEGLIKLTTPDGRTTAVRIVYEF